ncbi:Putative cell wall binding repeat 2 [Paramicrobacterium humi]|uniref:Putative cell wall binding repeat 2 n=1 Tax=Paramicrobacterium humi TaxID=640635 RepID=A0A1H4ISI7_9MICO|nr:cell wall-binding repeat-containing protein [Microbacterium humi]SEB37030.1 Putative cell wall binding repeat 2 [Microbacterium humi]
MKLSRTRKWVLPAALATAIATGAATLLPASSATAATYNFTLPPVTDTFVDYQYQDASLTSVPSKSETLTFLLPEKATGDDYRLMFMSVDDAANEQIVSSFDSASRVLTVTLPANFFENFPLEDGWDAYTFRIDSYDGEDYSTSFSGDIFPTEGSGAAATIDLAIANATGTSTSESRVDETAKFVGSNDTIKIKAPAGFWKKSSTGSTYAYLMSNSGNIEDDRFTDTVVSSKGDLLTVSLPQDLKSGGLYELEASVYDMATNKSVFVNVRFSLEVKKSAFNRLYGADRFDTSVSLSRHAHNFSEEGKTRRVYVATGFDYPDALSAAALAGSDDAPLLLVEKGKIPASVKKELLRQWPDEIVVVGGTGVISATVQKQLGQYAPKVTRVTGADRYATSQGLAKRFAKADTAFIATGRDFPDALAAGAAAGSIDAPVVLVDGAKKSVTASTSQLLKSLKVKNVVVAGGTGVVSSGISAQLQKAGYKVSRLSGADRYATANAINAKYFSKAKSAYIATGLSFADALAGSATAGAKDAPLFVTRPTCMPSSVKSTITKQKPSEIFVLGGPTVVSNAAGILTSCK